MDINNINLEITNISVGDNSINISWESDIGFGQYYIQKTNDGFCGYSECMDRGEDKDFLRKLMELFVEKIKIVE